MLPLRAFLMIRHATGTWSISVHRDLESVTNNWKDREKTASTGILHVGFSRPDTEKLEELCKLFPEKMLLTASARYIFNRIGSYSSACVDVIDELPVFVALSGWGYEITPEELDFSRAPAESWIANRGAGSADQVLANRFIQEGWLLKFQDQFPQKAKELLSMGIVNDQKYLELESKLPDVARITAGRFRFHFLSKDINLNNPQQIVCIAPPWVLNMDIANLDLPIRPLKALNHKGLNKVYELINLNIEDLLEMRNMGRKSIADIAKTIKKAIMENIPDTINLSSFHSDIFTPIVHEKRKEALDDITHDSIPFQNLVDTFLKSENHERSSILRRRMGFYTKRETLQEIADTLSITRERVRQIEAKICLKAKKMKIWKERIENPIIQALSGRETPLPLVGLAVVNSWFSGVENFEAPFEYVLENFATDKLFLVRISNSVFITTINQDEWDTVVNKACQLLADAVSLGWRKSIARENVGILLMGRGEELRDELFYESSKKAIFSFVDNTNDPILTGFGQRAEQYIEAVLSESERPLHYTEITDRVVAKGRAIDIRRVHNAVAEIGLLYGRGTYGLMKHFPLNIEETQEVVDEVEDLITSGPRGRQWHCIELCEMLEGRGIDMDGRLTAYVLNIALHSSKTLAYLGRLVWAAGNARQLSSDHRVNIQNAAMALLQQAGRPMSRQEIYECLREDRGLNGTFQVHQDDNIILLAPSLWGLIDRDVPLNSNQQGLIMDTLEKALWSSQKGIHSSEIISVLKPIKNINITNLNPTMIISLAQRTGRMRLFNGVYLGLCSWSDARRLRIEDAVRIALERSAPQGLPAQELKANVKKILDLEIELPNIYGLLNTLGAKFNNTTNRWQLVSDETFA